MVRTGLGQIAAGVVLAMAMAFAAPVRADDGARVIANWYRLVLELVRHTPTYSPPVASRAFSYLGVIAYEAVATGKPDMVSFAGQLTDLTPVPPREAGLAYDEAVVVNAAMTDAVKVFFSNTGPTGQRAKAAMEKSLTAQVVEGVAPDVVERSKAYGKVVADHIIAWSSTDGGAVVENMGFPYESALAKGPGDWVPTSLIVQQQKPLLPDWGNVRPFAMPAGDACALPPPPAYSEDPSSAFYAEAKEVYDVTTNLTPEQKLIARFWSDDPMLSPTPPGHWTAIAMDILDAQDADAARRAEVLARLGIAVADAFIGCWQSKYEYNLLRPVTYIRRVIDPKWEALLITPPFPEYPSGHSTQSGAAAAVLTDLFGENFAFDDATHEDEGMAARHYPSFATAAEEAALSRLYGGIHFRSAIERGLEQGRCIGAHVNALRTRK
ncbi:phosphoesterase PA-phosphatase [Gemmobacter aquarius]|uniref:Phosphoesterase PA-phosphatase n=1 Tax=Paragemmobacter aquarius TaxID=2169400 RepID=A0A2S0ULL0_9RHOB|nr:vanadium-dependent haloperoxidase [Gemmobacter aquarius]AWB48714.1 phosphoesterase PA-phosphatase [Gemmobacter aquarius]